MNSASPRRGGRLVALALVPLAFGLFLSSAAAQPDPELQRRLEEAMNAWDTLEIERAESTLDSAIGLAQSLDSDDPVVAQIYLMRGIVESAVSGDEQAVMGFFTEGLLIDREAELDPFYASPDLQALLEQARNDLPPPPEPPVPENALTHAPEVTVRAGEPVPISAEVERTAGVERVALYYKPYGANRYIAVYLDIETPTRFSGGIPASATVEGIQLEYYLQALDGEGDVIGHSATPSQAHVVVILEGDGGGTSPSDRIVGMAFGLGTGGGLATGEPVVMGSEVDLNPGIALTPLHFYVDATFRITDILELGPFLRLQTVLLEDGVEIEPIVGAKLKWFFANDGNPLMYGTIGGGYGYVRHTVDLAPTVDFVDTTREGPFHGGVGFGVAYLFTDHVGILTDLYAMVLFDEVSVQLDLNVGLYLSF